jgi:hypothetical protein
VFRQQYYEALDPKPVWPMQPHRVNAIYGTMKRTIRQPQEEDKANLKQQLLLVAHDFNAHYESITKNQASFDDWFDHQTVVLQSIPFRWMDAGYNQRSQITFGLTQKFLNLMLKDCWCMNTKSKAFDYSVLHAPFDRVMWDKLWALTRIDFPSLKQGGYYVYLSRGDYNRYQEHLLSQQLWEKLHIVEPLARIEVEQLVWGS